MTVIGKIHWDEGPISIAGGKATAGLKYFLWSDDPENDGRDDAFDWLALNAPDNVFGLRKDRIIVKERLRETEDDAIWDGEVSYVNPKFKKPKVPELKEEDPDGPQQESKVSLRSSTGGSLTMTLSKQLEDEAVADPIWQWSLTDAARLLNLQSDDSEDDAAMFTVKGISVPIGSVELVVESVCSNNVAINQNFLYNAADAASKNVINEIPFRGFPARSLRLINFDSSQRGGDEADTNLNDSDWDFICTFAIAAETPKNEISIPGLGVWTIDPNTPKGGWDYLDVLYVNKTVDINGVKFVLPQAVRASIHQIYDLENFAVLLRI